MNDPNTPKAWFSAAEFAARLSISWRTLMRWVAEGKIPKPQKFGKAARWPASVVQQIEAMGLDEPAPVETCPCPQCGAKVRVTRESGGQVALLLLDAPPPPKPARPRKATTKPKRKTTKK